MNEAQITDVWEGQISGETRALYCGDLANLYSSRQQRITGISFFLSSGAAATLIARSPLWVPTLLATAVAVVPAYAVAVNLDAPNDQERLCRWQDHVFKLHRRENA